MSWSTPENIRSFRTPVAVTLYIVRLQSGAVEELTVPGAALGSFKNAKFNQCEINLEPGDSIVLYTDGLVESRNGQGGWL